MNAVSYKGKIYIHGGINDSARMIYNGLDILDTINLSWGVGSLEGAPAPRYGYTATLVGDIIYYIGGAEPNGATGQIFSPMENVCKLNRKI